MERIARLFELQEVDVEADTVAATIAAIHSALGETDALREARLQVSSTEARLRDLERRRKAAEDGVTDLRTKRRSHEQRLYSGRVATPREMQDLQRDVEALGKQLEHLEDGELAIMAEIEETEAALAAARNDLKIIEAAWEIDQREQHTRLATFQQRREELIARRQRVLQRVNPDDLPTYDQLRITRAGRPVARVERGMCGGCRITLTAVEQQRARTSNIRCGSCGRFLLAA